MNNGVVNGCLVALAIALPSPTAAADALGAQATAELWQQPDGPSRTVATVAAHASVVDGRTLWLPATSRKVRLAGIDVCELPQWSFDPELRGDSPHPKPVPCGPLAKAWLKRSLGRARVTCAIQSYARDGALVGTCTANGRDLAIEMLRAGWARVSGPSTAPSDYLAWQSHAISARYGMWATYVLDMNEWRAKAVDRTLARKPLADFKLLAERETEILATIRRRAQTAGANRR